MNALQKRVLELFQAFLQVCQQLDLSYFLVCGSALGAVKYQGFVPWDDDMDLAMLRPDYEVFLAKAQPLLPQHIFLQNSMHLQIIKPNLPNLPHLLCRWTHRHRNRLHPSVLQHPDNPAPRI